MAAQTGQEAHPAKTGDTPLHKSYVKKAPQGQRKQAKQKFRKDNKVSMMVEQEPKEFLIHDAKPTSSGGWAYQLSCDGEVYKDSQYFAEADLIAGGP